MIAGLEVNDLARKLLSDAEAHRDYIADTRKLEIESRNGGIVLALGGHELTPTTHALHQVGEWAGIPRKYFDKMSEIAPTLLETNLTLVSRDARAANDPHD
jgi:hypothetical protein